MRFYIYILFSVILVSKMKGQVTFDNRNWVIGRYYGDVTRKIPAQSYTVTHFGGLDFTKITSDTFRLFTQDSIFWRSYWNGTDAMSGVLYVKNDSSIRYSNVIYGRLYANDSLHLDLYSGGSLPYSYHYRMKKVKSYFFDVGLNEIENIDNKILIYPNPCSQKLYLQNIAGVEIKQQYLITIDGKELPLTKSGIEEFDVSALPEGMYFLQLQTNAGTLNKKIIIKH